MKDSLRQGDDSKLRQELEIALKTALEKHYGVHLHQRVLASSITHEALVPSGISLQIVLRVEIHEPEPSESPPNRP